MFPFSAVIKFKGLVTTISGEVGPSRDNIVLELIGDNAPTGAVGTWPDTSGASHPATQAMVLSQPIGVLAILNGHKVVTADGVDDTMTVATFTGPATEYLVAQWSPNDGAFHMIASHGGGFELRQRFDAGAFIEFETGAGTIQAVGSDDTQWNVIAIQSGGGSSELYVNGVLAGTGAESTFTGALTLFSRAGSFFTAGSIADLRLFSVKHDTTTRQAWEDYIGALYGITITH